MSPLSDAQKRAMEKYETTQELIRFRVPKGDKEIYVQHAKKMGESLAAFLQRAAKETMERDLEREI